MSSSTKILQQQLDSVLQARTVGQKRKRQVTRSKKSSSLGTSTLDIAYESYKLESTDHTQTNITKMLAIDQRNPSKKSTTHRRARAKAVGALPKVIHAVVVDQNRAAKGKDKLPTSTSHEPASTIAPRSRRALRQRAASAGITSLESASVSDLMALMGTKR